MEAMEILHQIVAADKAARQRLEDARQERENFDERLEVLGRELAESALDKAEKDVDAVRLRSQKASSEALLAMDREREAAIDSLRRRFAEKKDEGVEKMFRLVVGLDD